MSIARPHSPPIKNPRRRNQRSPTPSQGEDVSPSAITAVEHTTKTTAESSLSHDVLNAIVQEVKSVNELVNQTDTLSMLKLD